MKSIKPTSGCASSRQVALLEEQLDQLQQDLGLLQKQVNDFGSSFNSASASITKLTSKEITSEKATLVDIIAKKLTNTEVIQSHATKDFDTTSIEIGSIKGNANLSIILKREALIQYIKLSLSNNVIIAQSSGDSIITSFDIKKDSESNYYISSAITEAVSAFVYSDSENFTAWKETPASTQETKTVSVGNKLTLSGDIEFNNQTAWTFNDITIDNANLLESLSLNDIYKIDLTHEGSTGTDYTQVSYGNGIVSLNNGKIILGFIEGVLVFAKADDFYVVQADEGYFIDNIAAGEYTLTVDFTLSPDNSVFTLVPNTTEAPNTVTDPKVLAENNKYIDKANIGDLNILNNLTTENLNTGKITSEEIENSGAITTDSVVAQDINSATATITDLVKAGSISLDKSFNLPEITQVQESMIKITSTSGIVMMKIVDDNDNDIASFTAIKDGKTLSNTIISYSESDTGYFKSFGIDSNGYLAFTTNLSKNKVYYGIVAPKEENVVVSTIAAPTETLTNKTDVAKKCHTLILGDGTASYGIDVNGEVAAKLIPLPGTTTYEDLNVSNTLVVGGETTLSTNVTIGNNLDVTNTSNLNDVNIGTEAANADLVINGTSTINGNDTINGNILVSGTSDLVGNTTIGTTDANAELTVNGKSHFKDDVNIGEEGAPKDIYINGNIYQAGEAYETHAQKVYTKDDMIITRDGAVEGHGLADGAFTGIEAEKYDGTNNGRLVFDNTGTARVGDVGDEKPLACRDEKEIMANNHIVGWNVDHLNTPDTELLGTVNNATNLGTHPVEYFATAEALSNLAEEFGVNLDAINTRIVNISDRL